MSTDDTDPTTPEEAEQRVRASLLDIVRDAKAKALQVRCGSEAWQEILKIAESANRALGWPLPRYVAFATGSPPDTFLLTEVRVVQRLTPGPDREITPAQEEQIRQIEEQYQGVVPLTREEVEAIEGGDAGRLLELAGSPG